jgi:hypothetical protein
MWDESGSPAGWKRKIKYNVKEYEALVEKVDELRERLGVRAVDVERVAWVLGREGVDCDEGEIEEDVEGDAEKEAEVERDLDGEKDVAVEERSAKIGTKRKAPATQAPTRSYKKERSNQKSSLSLAQNLIHITNYKPLRARPMQVSKKNRLHIGQTSPPTNPPTHHLGKNKNIQQRGFAGGHPPNY